MNRVRFLGARTADSATMGEVLAYCQAAIEARTPRRVVALNVPKMWLMERDERLRAVVDNSDLILPEVVIAKISRFTGTTLKACIGNDRLTEQLLPVAAERKYRLYFLGTRTEILETIRERLLARYPTLQIAGMHHGFFGDNDEQQLASEIQAVHPDILFVGMGTPRQEFWMERWTPELGVPLVIGVGGTLDVLAGRKSHCPDVVRKAGMEWFYRLLEDPRGKSKRYLTALPWFGWKLLTDGILGRFSRQRRGGAAE